MKKIIPAVVALSMLTANAVAAESGSSSQALLNKSDLAIGAGLARNSIDLPAAFGGDDTETGFQFFMAYDLRQVNLMDGVKTSIEFGYMDYGDFGGGNSGGIWVTPVIGGDLSGNLNWLARVGLDLGDDDGFMLGAGLGLELDTKTQLRFEYVVRDNIDSLQFNVYYHL